MEFSRTKKAKLNIIISLLSQGVTLVCGLIVPRLMLTAFGSEANGAVTSITQFLGYITFLEGGIGAVARSALYKPLAEKDNLKISKVLNEVKHFFAIIGAVFTVYVLILACTFTKISDIQCFNWIETFLLVIILSTSTFAQYFIGITNSLLLQSAQKQYISVGVSMAGNILNTIAIVILIKFGCSLHIVKLVSAIVFTVKPVIYWAYVKKNYKLPKVKEREKTALEQKWEGLGQHIAYVLHSHTDVAVLTIFKSLSLVSVYSVYNMVAYNLQNIVSSFAIGNESVFGDMLAKKEMEKLRKTFGYYETLLSIVSVFFFSVAAALITPFVKLYTAGITDADYYQPLFGVLLIISALIYGTRTPYATMVIAAGHFRQTKIAAYGEAVINIITSVILVIKFGLIGVAIGTILAVLFRKLYYAFYLSKNIICIPIEFCIKRIIVNSFNFGLVYLIGAFYINKIEIVNFLDWIIAGVIIAICAGIITLIMNIIFYRDDVAEIANKIVKKSK